MADLPHWAPASAISFHSWGRAGQRREPWTFLGFVHHSINTILHSPFYLPFVFFLRFHDPVVSETDKVPGTAIDRGGLRYILGRLCAHNVGGFSFPWRGINILWCRVPDRARGTTRYCVGRKVRRLPVLLNCFRCCNSYDRCACRRGFSIGLRGDSPRGSPRSSIEY
ncbi:hypothetical protein ES705_47584 [subsurface metagenome]